MFLVMGITGRVGGATAQHLLAQGRKVRALVRNREKAANWSDQGVELVDGDWNDAAAVERALEGVDGAFVMLPAVWAPSPDFREAKSVIANYVAALARAVPPRVVVLSSMGANRTSGLGMITALSLLEEGLRHLTLPIAYVRAGGFFENFLYGLHVAQDGTLPVYYNPTSRKSTMIATDDIGAQVVTLLTGPPSPDFREAKSVIANYVEALARAVPPRVVVLSSMGANRTSGLGMITALSLLEEGLRHLTLPIAYVRAGGFFENFLYGLHVAQDGTLPVYPRTARYPSTTTRRAGSRP